MVKSQFLCTFMIILIFFANLSEERPINGGEEVKSFAGFGSIIQTEQSKAQSRYNREFLSPIFKTDFQFCTKWVNSSILLEYDSFEGYFFNVFMGTFFKL